MIYDHVLDKRWLRRSFEHAASSYDSCAVLQREVCERMLSRLIYIKHDPAFILDAGSGTGFGTRKLQAQYPKATLIPLDIAFPMHAQARTYKPESPGLPEWLHWLSFHKRPKIFPVCADIEQLPLRDACIDMIWSNLAFQWCNDLKQTFSQAHRALNPGGLLMFSTFGPDTLKELRHAFKSVDRYHHVNRFVDMHDIGDLLVHCGFSLPVMDMEYITLTYDDVKSIMRDLKSIGAHNVTHGRQRGLMGKGVWQRMTAHYETLRQQGKLPATYEIVYGHAWKPNSRQSLSQMVNR
ncbi:MAG: malonyl-ACP O-methyltransferase BioC [Nitrosomonas sp.]|nr:malonyl-ACP O-methyltransferase BioC [Nitrosomonas sp.]